MSAPKHTPGPWVWVLGFCGWELKAPDGSVICDDGSASGEYSRTIDPERDCADAALLAASPKLLAALKGLLVGDVLLLKKYPYWRQEIEKAEAAIAEAEGGDA